MNWAYIAGFFDGEGCIHLRRHHRYISMVQSEGQNKVLFDIQKFLAEHGVKCTIYTYNRAQKNPNYQNLSCLQLSGAESFKNFILGVREHLIVKTAKADEILIQVNQQISRFADFHKRLDDAAAEYAKGERSMTVLSREYRLNGTRLKNHIKSLGIYICTPSEAQKKFFSRQITKEQLARRIEISKQAGRACRDKQGPEHYKRISRAFWRDKKDSAPQS